MNDNKMTRTEKSWILYDIANSAFILLVSTTIPIFLKGLQILQTLILSMLLGCGQLLRRFPC